MYQNSMRFFSLLGGVWFFLAIVIGSAFYDGYNHSHQFISELGARDAPHATQFNYFGFLPTAIFLSACCFCAIQRFKHCEKLKHCFQLMAVYAGTLGVAVLFPCENACRADHVSISQFVHDISAGAGYICGLLAVLLITRHYQLLFDTPVAKVLGYSCFIIGTLSFFHLYPRSSYSGLYQRLLEFSIILWIVYPSWVSRSATSEKPTETPRHRNAG